MSHELLELCLLAYISDDDAALCKVPQGLEKFPADSCTRAE